MEQGNMEENITSANDNPYGAYAEKMELEKKERTKIFGELFFPTLIYALLYAFCIYDNFSGILMAVFALATIVYCRQVEKIQNISAKKESIFYEAVMLLLGISSGITGNDIIIFFNTLGIFLMVVVRLLHNYYDDSKWQLGKYLSAIGWAIAGAIASITDLFSDASAYVKAEGSSEGNSKNRKNLIGVVIGIGIAIPLLAIIIWLLFSADIVFASVLKNIFHLNVKTLFGVLCTFIFGFFSAYCGIRYIAKHEIKEEVKDYKRFAAVVAITVLTLIAVVYLLFSGIQIIYLFMGNMTLPDGYTYAQYAREGFFQLLAVSVINVIMVLFVLSFFEEHGALKALLTLISASSYIMIASAFLRMMMYIQAYHLTRKRVLVLWALITIGLLLAGIVISIFKKTFPLFNYGMIVLCICYLILSFMRMDAIIASYNLSKNVTDDMAGLSTDAAPYIDLEESDQWVIAYVANIQDDMDESLRQWNFSHMRAKALMGDFEVKTSLKKYVSFHTAKLKKVAESYISDDPTFETLDEEGIYVYGGYFRETDEEAPIVVFSIENAHDYDLVDMGFYYSKTDEPATYMNEAGTIEETGKDSWEYETTSYHGTTEKICDHWYYFDAQYN